MLLPPHCSLASPAASGIIRTMDFYARSPMLGLEEGQARLECPPGTVKSYLPEWPWEECVPESETLIPGPPSPPIPEPSKAPEPALPVALKKARFLKVDPASGNLLDPETGMMIETPSAFPLTTTETVASVGVGLGIVALLLAAAGVFK